MIGGQKKKLCDFIRKSEVKYEEYINSDYDNIAQTKKNGTFGFGFVSHNDGLSEGVPVDIYTMLLKAEKLRREVLESGAIVHILIGDHFAYNCQHDSCRNPDDVTNKRDKYVSKLKNILQNLQIEQHYQFHFSSDIVTDPRYLEIRQNLEERANDIETFQVFSDEKDYAFGPNGVVISRDTWNILNNRGYDSSNRNYFLDQTAIFKYLYEQKGCGIKVSWAKASQKGKIAKSVSFDEAHFDRFYRDLYYDEPQKLSFIYTPPGYATNRNDEKARVIPYTAAKNNITERSLLSKKQAIPENSTKNFEQSVKNNVASLETISSVKISQDLIEKFSSLVVNDDQYNNPFTDNVKILRLYAKKPTKLEPLVNIDENNAVVSTSTVVPQF